jgi:hypothetical protein
MEQSACTSPTAASLPYGRGAAAEAATARLSRERSRWVSSAPGGVSDGHRTHSTASGAWGESARCSLHAIGALSAGVLDAEAALAPQCTAGAGQAIAERREAARARISAELIKVAVRTATTPGGGS